MEHGIREEPADQALLLRADEVDEHLPLPHRAHGGGPIDVRAGVARLPGGILHADFVVETSQEIADARLHGSVQGPAGAGLVLQVNHVDGHRWVSGVGGTTDRSSNLYESDLAVVLRFNRSASGSSAARIRRRVSARALPRWPPPRNPPPSGHALSSG